MNPRPGEDNRTTHPNKENTMKRTTSVAVAAVLGAGLAFGIAAPAAAAPAETCVTTPVIVTPGYIELLEHDAVIEIDTLATLTETVWMKPGEVDRSWTATGEKRWVETAPAIPGQPYIAPTLGEVPNPDYVAPTYVAGYWQHVPAVYTPAVGTPKITVSNPDYRPAVPASDAVYGPQPLISAAQPAVPAIAEVSHTEYEYKWWGDAGHGTKVWGKTAPTTRLNDVKYPWYEGGGYGDWRPTGASKKVITQAYVPGKPAVAAVYGPAPLITAANPGSPEIGTPTIEIDNPDYIAPTYVAAHDIWVKPVYTPAVGPKFIIGEVDPGQPFIADIDAEGYYEHEYVRVTEEWVEEGDEPTEGYVLTDETRERVIKEAWTEEIVHDDVVKDETKCTVTVVVDASPAAVKKATAAPSADVLASTGSETAAALLTMGGLLAAGTGLLAVRRRMTR